MSPLPQRLFLLHGMKRSGNHALVNWLVPQLQCAFFNNMIPLGPILRGKPMPPTISFPQWRHGQDAGRGTPPSTLVSLEDHDLNLQPFSGIDIPLQRILVLRNPRDLFASRVRKAFRVAMPAYPRVDDQIMRRAITLWQQHARCYLHGDASFPGRIAILFDTWFRDAGYRASVSAALGVAFDDSGFGKVSEEGGGSSFDGTRFDGNPAEMALGNRVAALDVLELALLDRVLDSPGMRKLDVAISASLPGHQIVLE